MTRKLRSRTGRGLQWALAGEICLAIFCILYLITHQPRHLVLGFAIAGIVGFSSAVSLWRGQDEFGPEHRRLARRGLYSFLTAGLFFFLALLSFGTFTAASTGPGFPGDNETTSPTTAHRFRDLIPPVVLLGIALTVETLSGAFFLWHLVGDRLRPAVIGYATAGAAIGLSVMLRGVAKVGEFQAQGGDAVENPAFVQPLFDEFLAAVLTVFALGVFVTRLAAFFLARAAREKVRQAEEDADREAAMGAEESTTLDS